jgi:uncharacterized membrane protein (UPF0127 family)
MPAVQTFAVLAIMIFAMGCEANNAQAKGPYVTIRHQRVTLEITNTRHEQSRGLGGRDSLAWGHGMLFEYPKPAFPAFWMKDMRFDIDIVWIRDGRIVDISHRVKYSPDGPGPTYRPKALTDTVLEVPSGYALAHSWRVGDTVTLNRVKPAQ